MIDFLLNAVSLALAVMVGVLVINFALFAIGFLVYMVGQFFRETKI